MGWWSNQAGGEPVNLADGYDETQGKMNDAAWDGVAPSSTIVSILKKLAAGGGTGGGPATIADGADVAQGSKADAAWASGDGTVISLLKKIASAGGSAVSVADGADVAEGTTTDAASANTVIGLLKNLKAALAGTLSTTSVDRTVSGSITGAGGTVEISCAGMATVGVQITGTWTGLVLFDATIDGVNWSVHPYGFFIPDLQLQQGSSGVNGLWVIPTAGFAKVRVSGPTTTGTAVVTLEGNQGGHLVHNVGLLAGSQVSANQGTAGGTPWPVSGPLTDTQLRATAVPVSGTVTASGPLTDTQLRASAVPVSGPLTDTLLRASAVPVSGTVTANQGGAPWSENLTQVGGTAIAAKAASTFGVAAIPVWPNAVQRDTWFIPINAITTGALVAATRKDVLSMEHSAAAAKVLRVRRIVLSAVITVAGAAAGTFQINIFRGTAATSGGTSTSNIPAHNASAAMEAAFVAKTLPTIVAATGPIPVFATWALAAAGLLAGSTVVYDWQENGETVPLTLRAGTLESIVIAVVAGSTPTVTISGYVIVTEE